MFTTGQHFDEVLNAENTLTLLVDTSLMVVLLARLQPFLVLFKPILLYLCHLHLVSVQLLDQVLIMLLQLSGHVHPIIFNLLLLLIFLVAAELHTRGTNR